MVYTTVIYVLTAHIIEFFSVFFPMLSTVKSVKPVIYGRIIIRSAQKLLSVKNNQKQVSKFEKCGIIII